MDYKLYPTLEQYFVILTLLIEKINYMFLFFKFGINILFNSIFHNIPKKKTQFCKYFVHIIPSLSIRVDKLMSHSY
jgi:hypothetical protein